MILAHSFRQSVRRRANFILTSLGLRLKGFYTPYDYLGQISWEQMPYDAVAEIFGAHAGSFYRFLDDISANEKWFLQIEGEHTLPDWRTRYISRLDGAAIYTGVSSFKPRKILEIGSGNSTHFMVRAIHDHKLATKITCIDPAPREDISFLGVEFLERTLSPSDAPLCAQLQPGDILFVDSSHILQQGFDVDIILNRILPLLKTGVYIHFHDIFLPYGYQSPWQCTRFNEQTALIPWLVTGRLEPVFASYFMWRDHAEAVRATCPNFQLYDEGNGGSLWLKVT
ncbi:MAG: class I SAM-dependent methyltransferase [Pseudomonadota bacterium]